MHAHAGAFAHRVQAVDHGAVVFTLLDDDLAVDVRRDAAHLVVDGGHHGNRFLGDVDVGEVDADLVDRRQPLVDGVGTQVVQLHVDVVLVGTTATAFLDFLVHRARHEVARCQVLQGGRIALHEAFAVAVQQDGAFAAAAFGQQHARAGHAGGVELPELHVLQRDARTCGHAQAVAGVDERVGGRTEDAACAAGGQQHGLGLQDVQVAGFHFEGRDADHVAFVVADEVQRHPFDEELGAGFDVLLVERVQHRVAGAVGRGAGALHGLLAVVGGVAAERTLVDRAVGVAVERHAEVFELVHDLRGFTAHELDRVLVAEPVGTLDRVVEVVVPVVLAHVAERGAHAALGSDGVRTGREHLGEHGHVEAGTGELQRGAHAGAAGTDDDDVELALGDVFFCVGHGGSDLPKHLNGPTRTTDKPDDGENLQHETDGDRLDVVHPHVAHADPHVIEQGNDHGEGQDLHPLCGEDAGPQVVTDGAAREDQLCEQDDREQRHQGAGDALAEPVAQTVVRADDDALGAVIHRHGWLLLSTGRTAWRQAPA
ncbi:hypothetical protein D3C71_920430 [compost metagenome]